MKSPTDIHPAQPVAINPDRGFLPTPDPLGSLPPEFTAWESTARELPKLLVAGTLRAAVSRLPLLDQAHLRDPRQVQRAMLLLSYFGHAYVWGEPAPVDRFPANLAIPWHAVAQRLGRPPVLSYASYALANWRRLDADGPIALGNIVLLQDFLGGIDEEWFILVHVEIEARAAGALMALAPAQAAARAGRPREVATHLDAMARSIEAMQQTLARMPEHCDPYIYFNRVRPYIHGWKDHPALPHGMIYEGVDAYAGRPQFFRGETGAQSAIVPALDAALGITHRDDPLRPYLLEMRQYMTPEQRRFLAEIEQGPALRPFVMAHADDRELVSLLNRCIDAVTGFRTQHLGYADSYIHQQAKRDARNPTDVGTGGTPFMPYLKKHRDETWGQRVEGGGGAKGPPAAGGSSGDATAT